MKKALVASLVLALLLGWGAAAQAQPFDMEGLHGGTLRVALPVSGAPDINPLTADSMTEWSVIDLLYDSLARIDPVSLLPEPWMAESWTVEDPWVNVTLRDGLTFHDASPVQAADVAFTFGASGLGSSVKYGSVLTGLVAVPVDTMTVSFDTTGMAKPGLFFTEVLTAPILPASFTGAENGAGPFMAGATGTSTVAYVGDTVITNVTDPAGTTSGMLKHHYFADSASNDAFNNDLVLYENGVALVQGTDYTFDIMTGDIAFLTTLALYATVTADYSFTIEHWTIDAYEGYWFGDAPFVDAIQYTWYPDDPTTTVDEAVDKAAKAIIDGSVDLIGWNIGSGDTTNLRWGGTEFETTLLAATDDEGKTILAVRGSPGFGFLYFGYNSDAGWPAADANLRLAATQLVNKENANIIDGAGRITHSPINSMVVSWYNPDQPTYDASFKLDATGRPSTNIDAGVFTLATSGYFDRDGDGWREDPAGNPLVVDILGPDFSLNPKWPVITDDFATALEKAGLQTTVTRMSSWTDIFNNVGSYDMYLGWADGTLDPAFLAGLEPVTRLADPGITLHLDLADASLEIGERQSHIWMAQDELGTALPMQPVLSFPTLVATTQEPFSGWVSIPGGALNFWSFLHVGRAQMGSLHMTMTTDAASLNPDNNQADVSVQVFDDIGLNVESAYVEFTAMGGGTLSAASGWTDANGFLSVTYTADAVTGATEVKVMATATKAQYAGDSASVMMTVHPEVQFLTVQVDTGAAAPLESGQSTTVTVQVFDQNGLGVVGAGVTLTLSQPGGRVGTSAGVTGANGAMETTFQADVTQTTIFTITAHASLAGYEPGSGSSSVAVFGAGETAPDPIEKVEQIPSVGLAAVVGTLVVLAAILRTRTNREE